MKALPLIDKMIMNRPAKTIRTLSLVLLVTLGLVSGVSAQDNDPASGGSGGWKTEAYKGIPLTLSIQVGEESILQFPWRVELGSASEMLGMVRNVPVGDSVYFTPLMAFDNQRFWAESADTGAMLILDITASADAPPQMIRFIDARDDQVPAAQASSSSTATAPPQKRESASGEHSYAALSRFALQTLHSPERLIEPLDDVSEQPLRGVQAIDDLVPGETVIADPVIEWRTGSGLYVTALIVTNMGRHSVNLDPPGLRHSVGWLSSAFWSTQLSPSGTFGDETTMVVISRSSWRDTVKQGGA